MRNGVGSLYMFVKMVRFDSLFFKYITVEPAFFTYYTTFILLDLVNTNLYLQKPCRLNATSEPDLETKCDDEKAGIVFVSEVNATYRLAMTLIMLLYVVLGSCWSDHAGKRRRPLIFMPIFGQLIQTIFGMLQSYYWQWSATSAVIMDMLSQCLSGGHLLLLIIAHVYVCDTSSSENRTMRIGILTALKTVSLPIGNGFSGYLLHAVGFFYSYLICFVTTLIALIFAILFLKDHSVPVSHKVTILDAFNFKAIADSFKVIFKKSLGPKKKIVYLLLCIHVLVWFSSEGEKTVLYLFLRYKFNWDERMYSLYATYKLVGIIFGTLFSSVLLSKILKVHDGMIGAFAGFWDTLAVIGYVFATENWHLYVIPLLDIFHGVAIAVYYSYLSKFYEENEFGRLSSSLNIFSLLIPFCGPVYNIIFLNTKDFFPSAFFLVSIVIDLAVCFFYGCTYYLGRKYETNEKTVK